MTVKEAIETRRSVRKFKSTPIEDEKLIAVLEAGRLSPSARNQQQWKFFVVRDRAILEKLYVASENQPSVQSAPAALVAVATGDIQMACGGHTSAIDTSIAFAYMLLRAWELGLGTCWLGRFHEDQVKAALNLPADNTVVAFTPLGYPDETPEPRPRKDASEIYQII
ncbi:MAG: nitroreductase family protein [Oscillospiraceae bacterium]|nr:nitroreductase family protein [Oscillospiraceae bacterium]